MKLHADLTRRAVVNSLDLDWVASPWRVFIGECWTVMAMK